MCLSWREVNGNIVPCHVCWQCKRDRVNDWVGRCIAESATSTETLRLTLTYGKDDRYDVDHPHARQLHYADVQKYLKRLRKNTDGRIRFFATGEYGSAKGRAHWHLVLFCQGARPPGVRFDERYVHQAAPGVKLWPHGWSFWEEANPERIRYAVKYILKDVAEGFDRVQRLSTQPELGRVYFRNEAHRYALAGLPPRHTYRFPGDRLRDGSMREYRLSRAALYKFLGDYALAWRELYGGEDWPQSDLMDAFCDERERRRKFTAGGVDDADFMRRFELERQEKNGLWVTRLGGADSGAIARRARPPSEGVRYRHASRGS